MAKKTKRRPLRASKTASAQPNDSDQTSHYQASTIIHPSLTPNMPHKHRCALARTKHTTQLHPSQPLTKPTLGDRFHALPPELRAHIFGLLLVQPVKWQLPHQLAPDACPRNTALYSYYPAIYTTDNATCVRCFANHHAHHRVPLWRALQDPDPEVEEWNQNAGGRGLRTWTNPWRSQWAPPVQNEFLCSECWDLEFRPRPHPAQEEVCKSHLRCLCTRRQDLSIFLVSRQWRDEAGLVFYTRNTFAFESAAVFTGFVTCLPQRWREKITRVSIMAHHPASPTGPVETSSGWEGNRKLARVWPLLHQLPRLSYLELDAHFLSRPKTAARLLKLTLRNVRRVCFVLHNSWRKSKPSPWVWPEYRDARLVVGGFAEEVARAIKGQRPRRGLRRGGVAGICCASEREEGMQARVMALHPEAYADGMACGNVYNSVSATAYARLWWAEQKHHGSGGAAHFSRGNGLHAYIPTEYSHFNCIRVETREGHWRDWTATRYCEEDFGLRNLARWREAMGWEVLFPIHPEEFLDESQKEMKGWMALSGIET